VPPLSTHLLVRPLTEPRWAPAALDGATLATC